MTTATAPATAAPARVAGGRWEQAAGNLLPIVLGAAVFVVAFVHVHDVAKWAGQPGWAAYLIAMTGELMAIAALAAISSRRRIPGASLQWPVFVLISAILFSGACNLAAVTHRPGPHDPPNAGPIVGKPGPWVGLMAVWPVVAFGLVAGLKATKPGKPAATAGTTSTPAMPTGPADDGGWLPAGTVPRVEHIDFPAPDITPEPPPPPPAPAPSRQVAEDVLLAAPWTRVGDDTGDGEMDGHTGGHIPPTPGPAVLDHAATAHTDPPALPAPVPHALPVAPARPLSAGTDATGPVEVERQPAPAPISVVARSAAGASPRPVAAVEFRAPVETASAAPAADSGDPGDPDVSDLLPDGRKVHAALVKAGRPLNRATLHAELKEHGHKAGTRRLDTLLKILREPAVAR